MAEEEEGEEESHLNSHKYPKSDETDTKTTKPYIPPPKHNETSTKCFIYILSITVLLSIAFLIFALVVLRIKTLTIRQSTIMIKNLHYSSSPEVASLNMTVLAEIRVENKKFGHFKFSNGNTIMSYGNMTIGKANIYGGRIGNRKNEGINVTLDVIKGDFDRNNGNFSKDFGSVC